VFKFIQQQQQKLSSLWSICIFYIISIIFWHWWSISTRNLDSYWYSTHNSYYSRYRCINPPLLSKKNKYFLGVFFFTSSLDDSHAGSLPTLARIGDTSDPLEFIRWFSWKQVLIAVRAALVFAPLFSGKIK